MSETTMQIGSMQISPALLNAMILFAYVVVTIVVAMFITWVIRRWGAPSRALRTRAVGLVDHSPSQPLRAETNLARPICVRCERPFNEGERFCGRCGEPRVSAVPEVRAAQLVGGQLKCPNCGSFKWSRRSNAMIAVSCVFFVVALLALYYYRLIALSEPADVAAAQRNGLEYVGGEAMRGALISAVLSGVLGGVWMWLGFTMGRERCASCGFRHGIADIRPPVSGIDGCPHCGRSNPRGIERCQWCHQRMG